MEASNLFFNHYFFCSNLKVETSSLRSIETLLLVGLSRGNSITDDLFGDKLLTFLLGRLILLPKYEVPNCS